MICWGLGAFGLGLTGILETNTKEDMGANSAMILLWGANLASQPNTARHLVAAKRRGAHVVTIDVRRTEAAAQSHETFVIRPGTDAALALGMMHVIVRERLYDAEFVARNTVGFDALATHVEGTRLNGQPALLVSRPSGLTLSRGVMPRRSPRCWSLAAVPCTRAVTDGRALERLDAFPR